MITKLIPGRPVIRQTASREQTDPVIAELHLNHLVLRTKGHGSVRVELDYLFLLRMGNKLRRRF